MRKLVWSVLAAMAIFLSGCTDETESMSSSEHTVVHLIPDVDVSTRGLTAPQQVNGYHLRYILEFYAQEAKEGTFVAKLICASARHLLLLNWN